VAGASSWLVRVLVMSQVAEGGSRSWLVELMSLMAWELLRDEWTPGFCRCFWCHWYLWSHEGRSVPLPSAAFGDVIADRAGGGVPKVGSFTW